MSANDHEKLRLLLRYAAEELQYPPTPDLSRRTRLRTLAQTMRGLRALAWSFAILLAVLSGLLAVPSVRAAVIDFFQVGVVRIFTGDPTPAVVTETFEPTQPSPLLNLAGETTLEAVLDRSGIPISLPEYPPDLGAPDHVFFQDIGGPLVVLVWMEPVALDQVRLSLHLLGAGVAIEKFQPEIIEETRVNNQVAYWTSGPYLIKLTSGSMELFRMVEGHVLIWEDKGITYRLETALTLDEALRIAESLR